jgi:tetratricopeptide (TPR) repeat protein
LSREGPQTPLLVKFYREYLDGQDTTVFVRAVAQHYSPATLERLATHPVREARRAAVLALGFLGDYRSNRVLGQALLDEDRIVRLLADTGIRSVWARMGSAAERREIAILIRLNAAQKYQEVISRAGAVLEKSPGLAEAWNQRAVAYFRLNRFAEAIRDAHETLEINPYHFAAATMMGQAYLELGNPVSALECFRRALRLNPDLEGVRAQVVRLARMVEGK